MYLSFYWLAMANSCVNPIVYYWMNKRYSKYIPLRYFMIEIVLGFDHTSTRSYAVAMQGNLMKRSHKHSPEGKQLSIFIYLTILAFYIFMVYLEISWDPMRSLEIPCWQCWRCWKITSGQSWAERARRGSVVRYRVQERASQGSETRFCI